MLVMAIEAANQVAETGRRIEGFQITDANFRNALRVPLEPGGIETQFQLQAISGSGDRHLSQSKFTLYSYANGTWIENCSGLITTRYTSVLNDVEEGKELLEQVKMHRLQCEDTIRCGLKPATTTEFYEDFWNFGINLGEDFHILNNIQATDDGRAIADLQCWNWTANGTQFQPQPHIIHPITLDGVFQASMAKFCQIKNYPTAVPQSVKSLWITKDGLSAPTTSSLKVRTKMTSVDNFGFNVAISVLPQSLDQLRIVVDGLRNRFISGNRKIDTNIPKQICYKVMWKPDPDLMTREQIVTFCSSGHSLTEDKRSKKETESLSFNSQCLPIATYLKILFFKSPHMKILFIGSGNASALASVIKFIKEPRDDTKHWDMLLTVHSSKLGLEQARAALDDIDSVHFQQFDIARDASLQGIQPGDFDLIIMDTVSQCT